MLRYRPAPDSTSAAQGQASAQYRAGMTGAERARLADQAAGERARHALAQSRADELRDEVDRMARLLIDAPAPAPVSQAA